MRTLLFFLLFFLLLANTLFAQPPASPEQLPNLGQAIGQGAVKSVSDLEARIARLEQLVPPYIPTWTWPGSETPAAFDRLREHLGQHGHVEVAKWSRAELAFVHDCEHLQELVDGGKALPLLKDQRLRDWLRSRSPARALPKKLGWAVKRIVMHTQPNCPPCERWKQDNLAAVQADGVEFVEAPPDHRNTPAFDVQFCDGEQCRTIQVGNMRYSTMKNMQL